ncbi:hypothetical protein SAMN05216389_102276 [Oceanobacillus limi]|uniref:Uncharacterized protein n=1 Tax=Oceanobacillus limi TaxID=930131 RepID=A0A1H9ZHK9_9BACI|nr:hypothetical protein SAMN05216389_102276 [Oceanobacillus limi]
MVPHSFIHLFLVQFTLIDANRGTRILIHQVLAVFLSFSGTTILINDEWNLIPLYLGSGNPRKAKHSVVAAI